MAGKAQCRSAGDAPFTIDVPNSWEARPVPGGCAALRKDGGAMISIASSPNRGLPAKAAAGEPANSRQTPADSARRQISAQADGQTATTAGTTTAGNRHQPDASQPTDGRQMAQADRHATDAGSSDGGRHRDYMDALSPLLLGASMHSCPRSQPERIGAFCHTAVVLCAVVSIQRRHLRHRGCALWKKGRNGRAFLRTRAVSLRPETRLAPLSLAGATLSACRQEFAHW